jgi:CheY-like chemotaxis protein
MPDNNFNNGRYAITLLNSVNHELRTPLSAISGFLYLLEGSGLSPKQEKFVELIKKAGERIGKITSGISDFCEFNSGESAPRKVKFKVSNILKSLKNNFDEIAAEKNFRLVCETMPQCGNLFSGDDHRIKQVLAQLLQVSFSHARGGDIIITAGKAGTAGAEEVSLRFAVSYKGVSPREDAVKVMTDNSFLPDFIYDDYIFKMVFARKTLLSIGGSFDFIKGENSEFTIGFNLKLKACQICDKESTEISGSASGQAVAAPPVCQSRDSFDILLIEDNFIGRRLITNIIESIGWKIDVACDALEGIKNFERKKYDLILLDIQLPSMDGYEFTKIVRDAELVKGVTSTPIIAVTAYSLPSDREKCLAAGMDGYISKPINIENFYSTINGVLKTCIKRQTSGE